MAVRLSDSGCYSVRHHRHGHMVGVVGERSPSTKPIFLLEEGGFARARRLRIMMGGCGGRSIRIEWLEGRGVELLQTIVVMGTGSWCGTMWQEL